MVNERKSSLAPGPARGPRRVPSVLSLPIRASSLAQKWSFVSASCLTSDPLFLISIPSAALKPRAMNHPQKTALSWLCYHHTADDAVVPSCRYRSCSWHLKSYANQLQIPPPCSLTPLYHRLKFLYTQHFGEYHV